MQVGEVCSDLTGVWRIRTMVIVPNSILLMVLCCASGSKPSRTDALLEPSMEGDVEALPVNETSVLDIEMSVDFSIQCG